MVTQSDDKEAVALSKQILEIAWRRFAQLDARSNVLAKASRRSGLLIIFIGIVFVILAILFDQYGRMLTGSSALVVKALLVLTPILSAILAAYSRKTGIDEGAVLRGGADAVLRDIYLYRTILACSEKRRDWLGGRLVTVQKQLSDALGKEVSLEPYNDRVPPGYSPDNLTSDPGFSDLSQDEYVLFRLEDRLAWFIKDNQRLQGQRTRLVMTILLIGGAGAIVTVLGGPLTVWSGIIVALAFAQFGWNELRKVENNLHRKNKIISDLMKIYENWNVSKDEVQDQKSYYKLVYLTEKVTWNHNVDFIQSVGQVLLMYDSDLLIWSALFDGSTIPSIDYNDEDALSVEVDLAFDEDLELNAINIEHEESRKFELEEGGIEDDTNPLVEAEEESIRAGDEIADIVAPPDIDEEDKQTDDLQVFVASTLSAVAEEYADTALNKNTPISVINDILNRFETFELDD